MTVRALGPVSSTTGAAIDLDFSTISIGLSKTVSRALIGLANASGLPGAGAGGWSFNVSVMSASGVLCSWYGAGDTDACGVGNGAGSSGGTEALPAREGAALFRFLGDALFDGEGGSGYAVCSGSNISEGSMLSATTDLRVRPDVRGVLGTEVAVFLRDCVCLRGLRSGAGVNSSSLSSFTL